MTLLNFKPANPDRDPRPNEDQRKEKLFLEHYSWLVECAVNITHGQRDRSEDLVHDVYVQFLNQDVDLSSITDIRWYLNGILRNLHLLQLRRAMRHPVQSFSLFDHDTAMVGLRAWTSTEQLQSVDLLARACDFACHRKETTLTASVLILRYFHGYFPGEICILLGAKRKLVYLWIERGRSEMNEYMKSPHALPSPTAGDPKAMPSAATSQAFLRSLRDRIFDSCTTGCSVLDNPEELGAKELAHLVSCRVCLERRSRKLGLAHVAERMADDISDRDDGSGQGGSGGTADLLSLRPRRKSSKRTILRKAQARRRELFEHRPKEISLAFDGQPRATLLVNALTNTLNVSIDSEDVPHSIAILSEQEFSFLILNRDELMCTERRVYLRSLSDDRSLEVCITPETLGPSIQVVYQDPILAAPAGAEEGNPRAITGNILAFAPEPEPFATMAATTWRTAVIDALRSFFPVMNPVLTSGIVLGILSALCIAFWLKSSPSLTPTELLDHAQKAELAPVTAASPGVIRQTVAIRTKRRSLERTIYRDAQGLRQPRQHKLVPEDEQLKLSLANAGVSWDAPLSASDYAAWRYRTGATRDLVSHPGPHLLTLTTTPLVKGAILSESLTVRDTDFHPVDRTVDLRDNGTIEVAELSYDVLPWGGAAASHFAAPALSSALPLPLVPHSMGNPLETELAVRYALHGLGADLGEPIEVKPPAIGQAHIAVVGIVASPERKQELIAALQGIPHVTAELQTEEEAAQRLLHASATREVPDIVTVQSPIEKQLLDHFGDAQAVGNFTRHTVTLTHDLVAHASALRQLSERYPNAGASGQPPLNSSSRQLLQAMRHDHRRVLVAETNELITLLGPVLQPIAEGSSAPLPKAPGFFSSAEQVQRLALELLSGSGWPDSNEGSDPARAAQDLLATLRDLATTLQEQQ